MTTLAQKIAADVVADLTAAGFAVTRTHRVEPSGYGDQVAVLVYPKSDPDADLFSGEAYPEPVLVVRETPTVGLGTDYTALVRDLSGRVGQAAREAGL